MGKIKVNDLLIKIFSLLAAIALWVFIINTTNPVQRMTFNNVPVQIQNAESLIAKGLILVPNQNVTTRVPLEGAANDLFSTSIDSINVILDINQRTLKAGEQDVQVTYVQTPSTIILNGSNPTVQLQVDEYLRKPVDIKKDLLDFEAAPGFYIPEPQLERNFVTVSGPKTDVDKVATVKPISEKRNISATTREVVKLEALDSSDQIVSNVTLSESYVEVTYVPQPVKEVPVEAIWEGVNPVINLTTIHANPTTVRITARENILRNILDLKTEPLDISEVKPGETTTLKNLVVPFEVTLLNPANERMEPVVEVVTVAEPIQTKDFTKNVTLVGTPSGVVSSVVVPVTATVSATQSKLAELNESMIVITADIAGLSVWNHKVPVKTDLPKDYTLIKSLPQVIEITIGN